MPLTATSPLHQHILQNLGLLILSLLSLPLTTAILVFALTFLRPYSLVSAQVASHLPTLVRRADHGVRPAERPNKSRSDDKRTTVLVTGLSMNKGLTLARVFKKAGCRVIGADTDGWSPGRMSRALEMWYTLPAPSTSSSCSPTSTPYVSTLLQLVQREGIDLWISCSGVSTETLDGCARDLISAKTRCKCVQLGQALTEELHNKDEFMALCQRVGLGGAVPETRRVEKRGEVHKFLQSSVSSKHEDRVVGKERVEQGNGGMGLVVGKGHRRQKHYILKAVGVDDASRSDMTLLPRRTPSATYDHVARLRISQERPWILQQFVRGEEYCTHAFVVRGVVKAFVACPSKELLMHYQALSNTDPLARAMLAFTRVLAGRMQAEVEASRAVREHTPRQGGKGDVTGHLSFDFLVSERLDPEGGKVIKEIKCIECNPRAHTAVALFRGREEELARAYLSVLDDAPAGISTPSQSKAQKAAEGEARSPGMNGSAVAEPHAAAPSDDSDTAEENGSEASDEIIMPLPTVRSVYWSAHDLLTLLIFPLSSFLLFPSRSNLSAFLCSTQEFITHILFWQEGLYEIEDPLPWWWATQFFWPQKFGACILQLVAEGWRRRRGGGGMSSEGMWSRINVSTGKVFGC